MAAEPKFTLRQMIAVAVSLSAVSGAGGAFTVAAQDAVQDSKIAEHDREIDELRRQVAEVTRAATTLATTAEDLEGDVDEIKGDTKEIQRLLNRLIGGRGTE